MQAAKGIDKLSVKHRAAVNRLLSQGLAKNTWGTYRTAERMWRTCEKETKAKLELPWSSEDTLLFVAWLLSDRGVSAATANAYLAGIRKIHELQDMPEPRLKTGMIKQILKGKKHEEDISKRNAVHKGRLPVTLTVMELLKEMLRNANMTNEEKLLVWAVSTIAFHGSFRIHEILSKNESEYDPDFTLMEDDFYRKESLNNENLTKTMLVFAIKSPKENRNGNLTMVDVHETRGPTCPVKAFDKWFRIRNRNENKILFRLNNGTPLTGRKFNAILRRLLEKHIDYSRGKITAHSFRSGVPSLLGQLGHSEEDIKAVGRWSSRAFEHYTKLPKTSRAEVAQKLGAL